MSEASVFGRYVLGRDVDERTCELYARASRELGYEGDDAVVGFAMEHRWSIGALDGALALSKPDALLRKKLLLMAAILETRPAYCDLFLPRERRPGHVFSVAFTLMGAGLQAAAGLLLLRVVR